MHELLDQILESGSQASARERLEAVTSELEERAPAALEVLEDGFFDATACWPCPVSISAASVPPTASNA